MQEAGKKRVRLSVPMRSPQSRQDQFLDRIADHLADIVAILRLNRGLVERLIVESRRACQRGTDARIGDATECIAAEYHGPALAIVPKSVNLARLISSHHEIVVTHLRIVGPASESDVGILPRQGIVQRDSIKTPVTRAIPA